MAPRKNSKKSTKASKSSSKVALKSKTPTVSKPSTARKQTKAAQIAALPDSQVSLTANKQASDSNNSTRSRQATRKWNQDYHGKGKDRMTSDDRLVALLCEDRGDDATYLQRFAKIGDNKNNEERRDAQYNQYERGQTFNSITASLAAIFAQHGASYRKATHNIRTHITFLIDKYKVAMQWVNASGQGVIDSYGEDGEKEAKITIQDTILKICPWFCTFQPILMDKLVMTQAENSTGDDIVMKVFPKGNVYSHGSFTANPPEATPLSDAPLANEAGIVISDDDNNNEEMEEDAPVTNHTNPRKVLVEKESGLLVKKIQKYSGNRIQEMLGQATTKWLSMSDYLGKQKQHSEDIRFTQRLMMEDEQFEKRLAMEQHRHEFQTRMELRKELILELVKQHHSYKNPRELKQLADIMIDNGPSTGYDYVHSPVQSDYDNDDFTNEE
ncbi:hypothetical protein MBANPS3_012508 [Mucor bainieri]